MKSRAFILPILCSLLALSACKPIDTSNTLTKVPLSYIKNGGLMEINAEQLYDMAITKEENLACFYSVDLCATCNKLKSEMALYGKQEHCMIYWIDMTNISKADYDKLYDITGYINSAYQIAPWKDGVNMELPRLDIYSHQGIVVPISDAFVDNLMKYTTVTSAS